MKKVDKKNTTEKTGTPVRIHAKLVEAGTSKAGNHYDSFVSFKAERGRKLVTLYFGKQSESAQALKTEIETACREAGELIIDATFNKVFEFEADQRDKFPRIVVADVIGEPICYEPDNDLPF